ncbi:pkip [Hemileuca sp. nucleopolyhedrovirus]|uniref:Pkip n=1 Tax=Hemileuca sp. nucleopolyhedrovirus TaxID=1367203 RepID=S5N3B9_9ABAC|nr:pkip [Hemileuca sp. nucleopolyhedrovirus]AGR56865.1 pkip [Hemileuca sp. nucleopolyhedrovirus]
MELDNEFLNLYKKRDDYFREYQSKVETFFRLKADDKSKYVNLANQLYVMSAVLYGLDEQLYSVENNSSRQDKIDFVNNLNELGMDNAFIEELYDSGDYLLLLAKLTQKDDPSRPDHMQKVLLKNCKKFTQILSQFVDKRKVFRKRYSRDDANESFNDPLLKEIFLLKTLLIKHLCILEKISKYDESVINKD